MCLTAVLWLTGLLTAEPVEPCYPGPTWAQAAPAEVGLDAARLEQARDYALTGGGSGLIVRQGRLVLSWGDPRQRYDLKSTTKSIGATALAVALLDGKLALDDRAIDRHGAFGVPPESNAASGWLERITLRHLATQTAGFEKPGGYARLLFEPGTQWCYSDGGPNWLAECVTLAYRRDVAELMQHRVFAPLGIGADDLVWRRNQYREPQIEGIARREFGSGVSANVDAMARIGYLYLRDGVWQQQRILPAGFARQAGSTSEAVQGLPVVAEAEYGDASNHYGLLWWNNADGSLPTVPRDAFWSWGLYDSLIVVIPSLDIVAARAGKSWQRAPQADHYAVLRPFLEPIVLAAAGDPAQAAAASARSGREASPVWAGIAWAPAESIVRRAKGSDNWPMTWADDGAQYTAYGDGRGFEPFVPRKLSLGLARITGGPDSMQAENLSAPTAEATGDGARGRKASGMLMVDGVLYLLARNTNNSQLAWSTDRGATWTWADWRFETSFGCPTFLNFGRNYAGAADQYVYVYSHDHDNAYQRADRFVLARVPNNRLRQRAAYEFFVRLDKHGQPVWSTDVGQRGGVFESPGRCYRSAVSYHQPTGRYLWCQTGPGDDPRFRGGLGIYDAPQPWGPWTVVYETDLWDVGPGETSSLPTAWMSDDGHTVHLVFSGDDCFSLRRATLLRRSP